jgi:hypothetical protein
MTISFTDLNGHSLLATQLMSRLRSKYHLEIPLQRFFEVPTIAGLASAIEAIRAASNHELDEPQLVPVRRDNRRGIVSADGVLQISNELDKD